MSDVVGTASDNKCSLSHYNRAKDTQGTFIKSACLPKSEHHYMQSTRATDITIAQQTTKTLGGSFHDFHDIASLVLHSEWANLNVITLPAYHQLFNPD